MILISAEHSALSSFNAKTLREIASCAKRFEADIYIKSGAEVIDAKSQFGLYAAELSVSPIIITAEGIDEAAAANALTRMLFAIA